MSKRPKEVYGKKLIYRYSAPVIFTLLFSLIALAAFGLSFLLPIIQDSEYKLTSVNLVMYVVNIFIGGENPEIEHYTSIITNNIFGGIPFIAPIVQVVFFMLDVDMLLIAIFAIILAIGSLVMLFSGRLKHWKLPYRCIAGIFWPCLFFYYGFVGILNIVSAILKTGYFLDGLYSYIFLGTLLVSTIVVHVIYNKAFKNHVYVKNQRTLNMYIDEYEKENVVVDTTAAAPEEVTIQEAPKPKIVLQPSEDQTKKNDSSDNRKRLPKGLNHIGGHAFTQNTALEEADIPLGIEVLGPGAFANCVNLRVVHIPESVKKIGYNCFFNCIKLQKITYGGSREMWKRVKRGSNWLTSAGTKFVVCIDGALAVNPEK